MTQPVMDKIVWPQDELEPSYQVEIGRTVKPIEHVRRFMKYGCSMVPGTAPLVRVEVKGKSTRKRKSRAISASGGSRGE